MPAKLDFLSQTLRKHLEARIAGLRTALGEVTLDVDAARYPEVMQTLRDEPELKFEQLIDLCGIDYSTYGDGRWQGKRFAVVVHLTSITHNWRVRVRCFAPEDTSPSIPSVVSIWNSARWFEREAFDLFGIVFSEHEDLRRILTDYDFSGYPLRKDFPLLGEVEARYDSDRRSVIHEPVTARAREVVPRSPRGQKGSFPENV